MKIKLMIIILFHFNVVYGQTMIKVSRDSLPVSIKENLDKRYKHFSLSKVIMESDSIGLVTYKIETRKELEDAHGTIKVVVFNLSYDTTGKIISRKRDREIYYTESQQKKRKSSHAVDNH